MKAPEKIIRRPLLTEKSTWLKETGGGAGGEGEDLRSQVLFEVAPDANKVEIRYAVEKLWNVTVVKVRTAVVRGKEKRVGRYVGRRPNWKKALVTLAAGQSVEFLEGV